ncbi:MAG: hypothetical protein SVW77_01045 [Candidatus Nanohaloarchaea archaeon]|nr:hypothetical protein [Candidatus Nanohaloarchaea archaeon]
MMELEIVSREEQALMDREEITVEIDHPGEPTPTAAAVRDRIAAELDLDPLTVEIESIRSSTGLTTSTGTIRVHDEPVHEELPEEGDDEPETAGDEEDGAEQQEGDTDTDEEADDSEGDEEAGGDTAADDAPAEDDADQEKEGDT